ncbi:DUF4102 domain-containing protein [Silicimonas algicola]|uniref:Integrase n=1 Tax=Silicimonas algicola TaxID=1826607 RepID=A0A316G2U8_9RHOB|nr:integrase arm-type DNA-binding domain-containing protein [Silicimonas algicola]AZQ69205.1 DUF4102 domain-containing protein [Silicimonas algicola]PWK54982.1 integrase [Silicimonas algicola]
MAKLTKTFIDRVQPPAKGYEIHWDDRVSGYGLRITASGVRAFVAQGRVNGKAVIVTIGRFGLYTEDQARKRAQSILQQMREGIDPRDAKKVDATKQITLRELADAYLARGLLKESTRRDMDRHIETAFKKWKDRAITSITPAECRALFEKIAAEGLRKKPAPAPSAARLYMVTLRTLLNFAIEEYRLQDGTPIILHNPVSILKRDLKPSPPRTEHIDKRQIGEFWNWLDDVRAEAINDDAATGVDFIKFVTLCGGRKDESRTLTWDRVNIDDDPTNCWWHIPDPKNKNPVWLPLSTQAVEVLKLRRGLSDSKFVFPSRGKLGHIMDPRAPFERWAKRTGMKRFSMHDLRRTAITLGINACGLDTAKLELLTNHVPQSVTQKHYLQTSDLRDYHREVQAIGDYIEGAARIAAAKASGANVVSLESRA